MPDSDTLTVCYFLHFVKPMPIVMKKIRIGPGFTVFSIFFGVAVLESFASGNILWIVFWLLTGLAFIISDNMKSRS